MREDLHLPPGKAAAKIGQAFLNSLRKAPIEIADSYFADGEGTQVCLSAPDEVGVLRAHNEAQRLGFPTSLVIEKDTVIACGIGPVMRDMVCHITKDFSRMK